MPEPAIFQTGELFERVQLEQVFPDGKTFPDCTPKQPVAEIVRQYENVKNQPDFDLRGFVDKYFLAPPDAADNYASNPAHNAETHISALWNTLTRQPDQAGGSLIPLPHPYVAPGGRFREIYYWDSYFTMLGLRISGRTDLIRHMIDNFAHLIDTQGYIPNGNRTYYLGRSQPPFFSLMLRLLAETTGDTGILMRYLPQLEKEHRFWMLGSEGLSARQKTAGRAVWLDDDTILNRYWDDNDTPRPESYREDVELSLHASQTPASLYRNLRAAAESGWDFSSRWFAHPDDFGSIRTTELIPVDLNCLLWHLEDTLHEAFQLAGNTARSEHFAILATRRQAAITDYCWDEQLCFFFDYDFVRECRSESYTLAAAFPLFLGLAIEEQAAAVADILEMEFLKTGGLATTLLDSGQQWDAPNGWAPLQWISYAGLRRYGHNELAGKIRERWLRINRKVYADSGKMTEKYNVVSADPAASGGEYPNQDGFGWTNGVFLAMAADE